MTSIAIASAAAASQSTVFIVAGVNGNGSGFGKASQTNLANAYGSVSGLVFGAEVFAFTNDTAANGIIRFAGTFAATFSRQVKILSADGTTVHVSRAQSAYSFSTGNAGPASAAASTWQIASQGIEFSNGVTYQLQFFR